MKATLLGLLALTAVLFNLGCSEGGVGDPCIPEDEYRADFAGYAQDEVNVESRSFQCETRVCLVNNFRGRVSCPYGQVDPTPDDGNAITSGEANCQLPDFSGHVTVPVRAQLQDRRPSDAVYCSCRCGGPQNPENANYCECPSGFDCEPLIDDLGLGKKELVGSYCVRSGTYVEDSANIDPTPCDPGSQSCGDPNDIF